MPTSRDGIERQPEDPGVETPHGRESGLESEEKETAPLCKRLVPKVGKVFYEGGPGEKRRQKMRFKERPVGRGEQDPLQGLAVSREDRDRIDGRPDGAAQIVQEPCVPGRSIARRTPRPARRSDALLPVERTERETPRSPLSGVEVRAERLAHGRFSSGVEFRCGHESMKESGVPTVPCGMKSRGKSMRRTFESGLLCETSAFENRSPRTRIERLRPNAAEVSLHFPSSEKFPVGKEKKEPTQERKRKKAPRASPSLPKERRRRARRTDERTA